MYSFSYLEPVCCSMSISNTCFLTCIQVSQEAGQVVWYSHLLKNFPQFIVIHRVKGFGIVNKAEIDVFLELSCFFDDPADVGNLMSGSSAFSKTSLNIWKFMVQTGKDWLLYIYLVSYNFPINQEIFFSIPWDFLQRQLCHLWTRQFYFFPHNLYTYHLLFFFVALFRTFCMMLKRNAERPHPVCTWS